MTATVVRTVAHGGGAGEGEGEGEVVKPEGELTLGVVVSSPWSEEVGGGRKWAKTTAA